MWWSNDVLEAFSNAMTPTNSNSSRTALVLRLQFTRSGVMCGGVLQPCILEVRRVFHRALGDRNFHIFFQVFAGLTDAERSQYGLVGDQYNYLGLTVRDTVWRVCPPSESTALLVFHRSTGKFRVVPRRFCSL